MTSRPTSILPMKRIWIVAISVAFITGFPVAIFCKTYPWVIALPVMVGIFLILWLEFFSERQIAGEKQICFKAFSGHRGLQYEIPSWKRTLDVVFILLTLPFVLPLAILIAMLIRMVSAGPVFSKHERIGYLGQRFMCFKFRTMFVGAETTTHEGHLQNLMKSEAPMVRLDARGDSRIIPFGLLLRTTGLDEIPILINVLRGEMSMVGPRPCLADESDSYLPWQRERFNTLPGLTGLWQVSGNDKTTFSEMMELDIKYIKNRSLWLDLKIIIVTIPAILIQIRQARTMKRQQEKMWVNRQSNFEGAHPEAIRKLLSY